MKRMHVVVIAISLLLPLSALPAHAQTGGWGSIISETKIEPGDSPLVRAAKATAAWRMTLTAHAATVIDNSTLRTTGAHFSQANDPATGLPPVPHAGGASALHIQTGSPQNNGQIETRIQNLKQEQRVMGAEADNPYSDQIDEDLVTKRMNQIPGQINQLQTQVGGAAQPANQTTAPPPVGGQLPQAQTSSPTTTPASPPPQ